MNTPLELIITRMREIEGDPSINGSVYDFRISGSYDFVRQLLREAEAEGQNVEHKPDSPFYFLGGFQLEPDTPFGFLGGFPIKAVANLPKNTFVIELTPD
jgi:hypothetical protein